MDIKNKYISLAMGALLMWSCNAHDDVQTPADDEAQLIRVGGVTTADMTVTATTRADATAAPGWLNEGLNELGILLSGTQIVYHVHAQFIQSLV